MCAIFRRHLGFFLVPGFTQCLEVGGAWVKEIWIVELGKFACGIRSPKLQLRDSRIPLTIEIQNTTSTEKNPESSSSNPESTAWNPVRLS